MTKRKKRTVTALLTLGIVFAFLVVTFTVLFFPIKPSYYSTETHIKNISERVEKKYFGEDTEFTGYKIYPLYDENDKQRYFLVEMEPLGCVFVDMWQTRLILKNWRDIYRYGDDLMYGWFRYRACVDGVEPKPYEGNNWKYCEKYEHRAQEYYSSKWWRLEVDDNNEIIYRYVSPYKLAKVLDKKLYLLRCDGGDFIPAVKNNGKYLNLVSMEEFDYNSAVNYQNTPCIFVGMLKINVL